MQAFLAIMPPRLHLHRQQQVLLQALQPARVHGLVRRELFTQTVAGRVPAVLPEGEGDNLPRPGEEREDAAGLADAEPQPGNAQLG